MSRPVSGSRARAASKAETREALLAAGLAEFAERGLDEPSLDAICARAGYTRGAFYVHFRDRDDFAAAVMERFLETFLDGVVGRDAAPGDLEGAVTRFAGALGVRGRKPVPLHRLLEAAARVPEFHGRLASLLREAATRLSRAAREAQRAGRARSDADPGAIATLLVALAVGAVAARDVGLPLDVPRVRDAVLRLLRPAAAG
jgi:AcrR family transcriptional regulator